MFSNYTQNLINRKLNVNFVGNVQDLEGGVACESPLLGALAAGREKEGELATTSLEF